MAIINCPECKREISGKAKFCHVCGYKLVSTYLIKCPVCSKDVSNEAAACPNCGQPINTSIKCPKCGSKNTKIISGGSKVLSIELWGPFAANNVLRTGAKIPVAT